MSWRPHAVFALIGQLSGEISSKYIMMCQNRYQLDVIRPASGRYRPSCGILWHVYVCTTTNYALLLPARAAQGINLLHKPHNAPIPYPTMHHFTTEMCTCVYISVIKWCIVVYLSNALRVLWDGSIVPDSFKFLSPWLIKVYWLSQCEKLHSYYKRLPCTERR